MWKKSISVIICVNCIFIQTIYYAGLFSIILFWFQEILKFIENSPHGVIYFTFGSTVKLSTLSKHILNAFKDALAQVPQRVLWKYEGDMEDKPENMMIKNWFPQRDILCKFCFKKNK